MAYKDGQFRCDMTNDCAAPITHIDEKGYVYCREHGIDRRINTRVRCRKLTGSELKQLKAGMQLERY